MAMNNPVNMERSQGVQWCSGECELGHQECFCFISAVFFFSWVVLSEHPHFGCSFQDHAVFNAVIAQEGNWEEEQILTWTECCAPSAVLLNSYLSPWRYLSENNKLYSGCAHSLSHMFSCSFSRYLSDVLFPIKLYPENSCQLLSCSVHINPIPNTTADVWSTT